MRGCDCCAPGYDATCPGYDGVGLKVVTVIWGVGR